MRLQHPASEPDDEPAELSDTDFYRQLRQDVDGVAAGGVEPGHKAPAPKDRPWGKRHKRRDRYGRVIG